VAYITIDAPGSEFGPCIDEACGHTDCAATRAQVASQCPAGDGPIGYERAFAYGPEGSDLHRDGAPWHLRCLHAAADLAAADRVVGSTS
jgi:hypothetical protein